MNDSVPDQVVRQVQRKYYGKFRAFVVDNDDPEQLGRIRARIPSVLGEEVTGWALPCSPFGGLADQAFFMLPELDAQVWVEFEEGELSQPIWTGMFWQRKGDIPREAIENQPATRLIKTPGGNLLQVDDKQDEERIRLRHAKGAELLLDKNGNLSITDAGGATVVLDAEAEELSFEDTNGNRLTMRADGTFVEDSNGNRIEMDASGIKVQGQKVVISGSQVALGGEGGQPLVKGSSFMAQFNSHIHTAPSSGGPTSPPYPPVDPTSVLSVKTTTT